MTTMKLFVPALLLALFPLSAAAEDFPSEPYEFLMAKAAAESGRYDEALSRLDRVIEKNPGNPVLLYERSMILIDSGRIDRAESELRRLVAANPDFADAQRVLGRILLERAGADRGRMEEALRHLRAAYTSNPDDLSTGVAVSQLLVATGQTAEAERVLASLVERSPDQRVLNYNYAQVLTKLGRGDESRPYLERAVALDPTFAPAVYQLIDIYTRGNEWQRAAEVLQPMIEAEPLNVDLRRQQAFYLLRAGDSEQASAALKTLVAGDPNDERSMFYLGQALNDMEEHTEAEKIYRRLLERSPNDPDLLANLGITQLGTDSVDDAEKTFRALLAVPAVPDNFVTLAHTQLGYIALQRRDYEGALRETRPVFIFDNRPNGQAINIALEALRKQKKYTEAVEMLRPLVARFPADPMVNARYVEMLIRAGDTAAARSMAATQAGLGTRNVVALTEAMIQAGSHDEAVRYVSKALEAKPDDIDLLFELGSAHERAGDHEAAEKAFLALLEKSPDHAATLNYLGYMWADSNTNLERAAEMLTRAVSQEPRNGAYVDSLGWVYYRQGKLDLAEKYLTDAARLLPRDATVHEHLADVLASRGKVEKALEVYRMALTFDPEPKDEEKIRSKIAEVERQVQR
jgi:tetratricopeptide (TPR) repeat protein